MYVDSHCHLDDLKFQEDLAHIIQRATENNVRSMLTIGTTLEEIPQVQKIAHQYPQIYYSVGVHPDEAHTLEESIFLKDILTAHATDPKMIGFGETGLDYYRENTPHAKQQYAFRAHLQAASACKLPVIIHCRGDGAEADVLRILDEEQYTSTHTPGVLHCFTGSRDFAYGVLERGFYISFSGIITFKNAAELQELARALPLDRILIETDAPYLAPMPFRGKRNEPSFVVHTAAHLATLKQLPVEVIAAATTNNFYQVFPKCQRL